MPFLYIMDIIRKKKTIDSVIKYFLLFITILVSSSIIFIVLFILIKGISPFINNYEIEDGVIRVNFFEFISGFTWSGYTFGILGSLLNTIYLTFLATLISLPISVLTALFIVRIAGKKLGAVVNTVVELLAAIPSIVFGIFGSGVINNLVKNFAGIFGIQTYGGVSVLSTVLVLVMMMTPTITMLSVTSIKAVKKNQIEASLALGASKSQTDYKIVLRCAKSGIFAALILGIGRALGEATAVSMVCGNAATGPNFGLFDITRTLTSTMLLGLHESSGITYDIRLSVGIVLIVLILGTSVGLNAIKRKMEKI